MTQAEKFLATTFTRIVDFNQSLEKVFKWKLELFDTETIYFSLNDSKICIFTLHMKSLFHNHFNIQVKFSFQNCLFIESRYALNLSVEKPEVT